MKTEIVICVQTRGRMVVGATIQGDVLKWARHHLRQSLLEPPFIATGGNLGILIHFSEEPPGRPTLKHIEDRHLLAELKRRGLR